MISRRISCKPQNDNYRRLADYIADAKNKGEKTLYSWNDGCWAGENYQLAIQEVLDTQDLNQRTRKEKTYHLIVSFRPEDEALLTPEKCKEIEKEFAKVLGFEEHQRHCGVHKNTNNLHMHIAYNMIHPETLTRHEPYRDYFKRDRLHRELELKFGLKFDNGRQKNLEPKRNNDRAETYEAHSGQQSFDSYVKERKEFILESLDNAQNWHNFHKSLAQIGIEVKARGNGCIIKDRHSSTAVKASRLDRNFTKGKLEAKLGQYQKPIATIQSKDEKERYVSRPLHKKRGELYSQYCEAIDGRKKAYEEIKLEQDERWNRAADFWGNKIKAIKNDRKLTLKDRSKLLAIATGKKAENLAGIKTEIAERRAELRKQTPFNRWNDFLKWKAENGDEVALQVLRSKKEPIESTPQAEFVKADPSAPNWKLKQSQFRVDSSLAWKDKRKLISIAKMLQLQAEEKKRTPETDKRLLDKMTWRVDSSGNVLYTLKSGGMVKDNGDKLFFSVNDPRAAQVATRLAKRVLGPNVKVTGNEICRGRRVVAKEFGR
ncbi:TraI/MobA(P) family conjugative relaxase [Desulfovibrio gilichinskyi]|uniref:Relaxase/Mobilisation nuclease domain-containing protein n=1 Tax=Desulfovibrio gilichinskyi TaxID=1519643 RepID=A0A1X7F1S7_9BACT|nr:TraI/MobA(P) family conjugative relaxase [Desulfovibrio gilichinskyi]SMF44299.1 Relaxase/Mobilisation nuclease domain-containing protein [Desulfovibrio gilichinskyi]